MLEASNFTFQLTFSALWTPCKCKSCREVLKPGELSSTEFLCTRLSMEVKKIRNQLKINLKRSERPQEKPKTSFYNTDNGVGFLTLDLKTAFNNSWLTIFQTISFLQSSSKKLFGTFSQAGFTLETWKSILWKLWWNFHKYHDSIQLFWKIWNWGIKYL
jgi:hypothetical protein